MRLQHLQQLLARVLLKATAGAIHVGSRSESASWLRPCYCFTWPTTAPLLQYSPGVPAALERAHVHVYIWVLS